MTCSSVMNRQPVTLQADDTVAVAVATMRDSQHKAIPVVDGQGRYLGLFNFHALLGLLLPKVVTVESGLRDLSFASDMQDSLREKLKELLDRPVKDYLEREVSLIHPDMPLMEAVLLLYKANNTLPVVERDGGKLVGMLSPWDVLDCLEGTQHAC
ncbi:MAG: HPP family protein [Sulfuricellaceae bacterium]|jgi:CBS domain-containing protein